MLPVTAFETLGDGDVHVPERTCGLDCGLDCSRPLGLEGAGKIRGRGEGRHRDWKRKLITDQMQLLLRVGVEQSKGEDRGQDCGQNG